MHASQFPHKDTLKTPEPTLSEHFEALGTPVQYNEPRQYTAALKKRSFKSRPSVDFPVIRGSD
ncbi:hypothetical protein GCM10027098_19520 [Bowmanella dokdonensis]